MKHISYGTRDMLKSVSKQTTYFFFFCPLTVFTAFEFLFKTQRWGCDELLAHCNNFSNVRAVKHCSHSTRTFTSNKSIYITSVSDYSSSSAFSFDAVLFHLCEVLSERLFYKVRRRSLIGKLRKLLSELSDRKAPLLTSYSWDILCTYFIRADYVNIFLICARRRALCTTFPILCPSNLKLKEKAHSRDIKSFKI